MCWFLLCIILPIIHLSNAWIVTIDSYTTECFYEFVNESDKVGVTFMVIEGGFLDIDMTMKDPDGRLLHETVRETSGKYTIVANKGGKYEICFSSNKSSQTPKEIMFDVLASMKEEEQTQEMESLSNKSISLQSMINELKTLVTHVQREQQYMSRLNQMHMKVNEHLNVVVVRWALFETLVIAIGTGFQVWNVKRLFEVRWNL